MYKYLQRQNETKHINNMKQNYSITIETPTISYDYTSAATVKEAKQLASHCARWGLSVFDGMSRFDASVAEVCIYSFKRETTIYSRKFTKKQISLKK